MASESIRYAALDPTVGVLCHFLLHLFFPFERLLLTLEYLVDHAFFSLLVYGFGSVLVLHGRQSVEQ